MADTAARKQVLSWALYDWANSAFATTVMAGLLPVFFKDYWSAGSEVESTFRLGAANSIASLIVAALAPFLGAIADRGSAKKKFLLFFAVMGIVMTGGLPLVAKGDWLVAAALYAIACIGFSGGNIFYDSLLLGVAAPKKRDFVSALGYALGYLGGGLLFALNVWMVRSPGTFGLADQSQAVKVSFISVALWWAVFSLPVFLFVKEPEVRKPHRGRAAIRAGLRQLRATFREIRKLRVVLLFLVGYWFYIDGVDTIIRMAVDYGKNLAFPTESLILALLITQFVGFPAAIAFGKLGEKLGAKRGIFLGLGVYIGVCVWGSLMQREWEFYVLAIAVGLVQGGVQALSRSFYSRLIPSSKSAEFFGFYNMLGKFAAVLGPLLMGLVGKWTNQPRYSILSIILLFVAGATFLFFVNEQEGQRAAQQMEGTA